jgi:ERCC4-type nuclease
MKEKVKVRLDVHEQKAPEILMALDNHSEVEGWKLTSDIPGDMEIYFEDTEFSVLVERKTPSDYAGTLTGKEGTRLDEQIQKLSDFDGPAYILIEGNQEDFRSLTGTNIPPQSLVGSVASTDVRYLEGVRFCSDADGLVDMAIRLARKHKEDPSASSLQASTVEKDASFFLRALGSLDGVGPETARMLEQRYRSLSEILKVDVEEFRENDGIGKKRAKSIYRQLHGGEE